MPLVVQLPGATPRRSAALTTLVDVTATILELAEVEVPPGIAGESLVSVLHGDTDEHRELVVSSWPLEYQKGRITIAVDSWPRRVARDQPMTVTGSGFSLVVGGADDELELYDLEADPGEGSNIAGERPRACAELLTEALAQLRSYGASDELLAPRLDALTKAVGPRAATTDG